MVRLFPPSTHPAGMLEPDLFPDDLSRGHIGLLWGDWGIGKTTIALQAALNATMYPRTCILYILTHRYPVLHRIGIIRQQFPGADIHQVFIIPVENFRQLRERINDIEYFAYIAQKYHQRLVLVIVDSVTNLYTLALGKREASVKRNQELNQIFGFLKYAAKTWEFSVLLTAEEKFQDVENVIERKPAGGRIMDHWTDFSLKISRGREFNLRKLEVKKHPAGIRGTWLAAISEAGIQLVNTVTMKT